MSRRNRLTLAEQETIILWDNELDIASVYTHDQRIANKLKELEKKYPDQFRLKEKGPHRSVTYEVPKRCVNIRPPYNEARRSSQAVRQYPYSLQRGAETAADQRCRSRRHIL